MKLLRKPGVTSEIWQIFIQDSSATNGAGLTGLTNASSGLTAYYHRDTDTTATAISLVSMTIGTFTSSGFKEIDATNMPGWYQFCPPNAALAAGAVSCAFHLKGATNMAPLPIEVDLDGQVDLVAIDGQLTDGNNATLNLKKLNIVNSAGDAIVASATGSDGAGINASGNGTGPGLLATGGDNAHGLKAAGGATTGSGIAALAGGSGHGVVAIGVGSGDGLQAKSGTTGNGLHALGGNTSGDGMKVEAAGSGLDINANNSDIGGVTLSSSGVTSVAAGVWDRLTSAITTAGSIGKIIINSLNQGWRQP